MFQKNETWKALKECYFMSNIPKRNLPSGCHLLRKIDQTSCRTTRRDYKHIPHIVCTSSRSEVLKRYTVLLVCYLKHGEAGWFTRNYPHTGHLLETCTLSRWRDAVFLREVSIGRSKEDEKWIFSTSSVRVSFVHSYTIPNGPPGVCEGIESFALFWTVHSPPSWQAMKPLIWLETEKCLNYE